MCIVNGLFVCPIKATRKKQSGNGASQFFFKFVLALFGARCARPTLVAKSENCLYIYMFIYIYVWYVRIPYIYIHSAPFVRDAIFPHCMLVDVTTVAQEKRLAGQKG